MTRRRALERAYRRARYRVDDGDAVVELIIDAPSEAARAILERFGAAGAAFVTACNPGSERVAEPVNRRAGAALADAVAAAGLPSLDGVALDPDDRWPPEPSLLVVGISRPAAQALARRFGQNALVWIDGDGTPTLVWTRP